MIAQQAHDPAAGLCRFFLQRHHQVHDLARLGAAIQEVPGLDERCLTAGPVVLLVDQTGALENGDKVVKVTMNIADGDYGFRRLGEVLLWSGPASPTDTGTGERKYKRDGEKPRPEGGPFSCLL